jgi:palmitoyltransferase ZDHHC9/14/18
MLPRALFKHSFPPTIILYRVGNCVGKRNYRYFISFVWSTCILCIFVFGVGLADIVLGGFLEEPFNFVGGIGKSPIRFVFVLICFLSSVHRHDL